MGQNRKLENVEAKIDSLLAVEDIYSLAFKEASARLVNDMLTLLSTSDDKEGLHQLLQKKNTAGATLGNLIARANDEKLPTFIYICMVAGKRISSSLITGTQSEFCNITNIELIFREKLSIHQIANIFYSGERFNKYITSKDFKAIILAAMVEGNNVENLAILTQIITPSATDTFIKFILKSDKRDKLLTQWLEIVNRSNFRQIQAVLPSLADAELYLKGPSKQLYGVLSIKCRILAAAVLEPSVEKSKKMIIEYYALLPEKEKQSTLVWALDSQHVVSQVLRKKCGFKDTNLLRGSLGTLFKQYIDTLQFPVSQTRAANTNLHLKLIDEVIVSLKNGEKFTLEARIGLVTLFKSCIENGMPLSKLSVFFDTKIKGTYLFTLLISENDAESNWVREQEKLIRASTPLVLSASLEPLYEPHQLTVKSESDAPPPYPGCSLYATRLPVFQTAVLQTVQFELPIPSAPPEEPGEFDHLRPTTF